MADSDVQILATGEQDAPLDYVVKDTVVLQPKMIQALFTDNGAAGDWLPAVVLLSDSGHVLGRAVDQGVKVTAGNDAEVSWFPDVNRASSGGGTFPTAWVLAGRGTYFGDAAETIANNTAAAQTFLHFITSDTTVFSSLPNGVSGDNSIGLLAAGIYTFIGTTTWQAPPFSPPYAAQGVLSLAPTDLSPHVFTPANAVNAASGTNDSVQHFSTLDNGAVLVTGTGSASMVVRQQSGGNAAQIDGIICGLYWGMPTTSTRVYG